MTKKEKIVQLLNRDIENCYNENGEPTIEQESMTYLDGIKRAIEIINSTK